MYKNQINKKIQFALIGILSLMFLCGIALWGIHNYNNIFNYNKVQDKNRNEIRQEYLNVLYDGDDLTKAKAGDIILMNDFKEKHGDFTECRPEDFIKAKIISYKLNDDSIDLNIKDSEDNKLEKEYYIKDLSIVDSIKDVTNTLKVSNDNLVTDDNNSVDLKNKTIYIIVNDVHGDKSSDDVFIMKK